jgi:2-oxoglutarate dehydrogenase E2 component (dihydrolipoamide succinyltransferase)
VGEVIGYLEPGAAAPSDVPAKTAQPQGAERQTVPPQAGARPTNGPPRVMPAAQRVLAQHGVKAEEVEGTGPGGRILKEDAQRHLAAGPRTGPAPAERPAPPAASAAAPARAGGAGRTEEVVPMTSIRKRIAQRLVEAQQTAALLTTFNEIDMSAVVALRERHREAFQEKHGVKLGFMSFFVKAVIDALQLVPQLNAEIRGTDIVYRNWADIGVAVGSGKGLVVPVLRGAERMSFAEVERSIGDFGRRAQQNQLTPDELQGGTFTISNGGVYGSLLSTPIVNPPQSGILGLHAIQDRPIAVAGQVVVRPMMYVALTYDHRIVDGREAVTFLKRIKEVVEEPSRMLLEV